MYQIPKSNTLSPKNNQNIKGVLIILLLLSNVFLAQAQPTIGTTTFDGPNVNIAPFGPLPRSGTVDGWSLFVNGAGSGSINHNGANSPSNVNTFIQTTSTINIGSNDGSEFNFDNYVVQFFNFAGVYTITSYKDGVVVGSTTATASSTYGIVDLSGNTDFDNIDEIRLTGFAGSNVTLNIDEITISAAAIPNITPTASNFTASNGPYEDLTYTFSTSDFGYSDGDGDPLDHVLIEALPGAGTLYVDADSDGGYDGGEELSVSDQVSKTDLDAGNLQYMQNGSTNTSFQFEVNDGTENSTGNYVATLNVVGIPTVTLSISPSSIVESTSANATVTATLSNVYGVNTNVSLGFSGTATNISDYTRSGTSISITSGSTTGSITLSNQSDALYEGDETVIVDITVVTGGNENGTQQDTYTIIEDDPQPSATLLLRDSYNPIADESGGQAYIVSELSAVAGVTVTVPLVFSGTATGSGTDYGISGSSIVISPGEPRDSILVTSVSDGIEEGDETIVIDMGAPTNATESGTQQETLTITDEDAVPPSGYFASIDQSPINASNEGSTSFTFAGAEVGATYNYTFSSSGGGANVTGSGTIATATDQISGIDLSGLGDGTITLSATLTDGFGNTGTAATDTETKDATAPTGYSVSIDQTGINTNNENAVGFTFAGAEVGADYDYTFSSSGGGANVTGSGTIASATDQITGIDLSGLGDGTVTLSVTLTDGVGNTGSAATDTETKDTVVPAAYSVTIDQSPINVANQAAVGFTFSGAEVGTDYDYTFSSSGGGTNVAGSGTIATATDQITGIDLSGLGDGTITLSVTLTDGVGNTGTAATDTETKDASVPTGYSVSMDQAFVNIANETAVSFTFAAAEVGSTYNYTFSSSGGGANVTGSGTISTATDQITGIDLSGLGDGTITLSVTLTDTNSNTGAAATDTTTKDTSAPNSYSVTIDQSPINLGNESAVSFTFGAAEVSTTYNYTFSSNGGGTDVSGSGTIATATDQITGIDLSGLGDGTVTLSVTLTDAADNTGAAATDTETKETVPPSGYSVTIDQSSINEGNETAASFTFAAAEVGTTYDYTFSSSGGGANVTGSGTVSTTTDQITGIDLSGLGDGTITLSTTLTDSNGNTGSAATDTETKDTAAPAGYSVAFDQAAANAGNETAVSFTFASAEVGATYDYTISSSGGGTNVTGSGTIATATDQITGIDVSGLGDGTLTLSATLTDTNGNTGAADTDNIQKDVGVPSGYSVSMDLLGESFINVINESIIEFSGSGLEVGTTLYYSFTSDGGGTPVAGTETVTSTSETFDNSGAGYDLSGLNDGTVTLTISLTDDAGNIGSDETTTETKDAGPPTGYTVAWDNAFINASEATTATFTVSNAEIGATINNSVSSSGDGNTATVSNPTTVTSSTQVVTIDVSSLVDGVLTVEVSLTDGGGNTGGTVNDNSTTLDQTVPSGYTVSIDQASISVANQTATSFTFAGAEVGTTYNYTLSSDGGGTDVTGSGTIVTATDQVTGIDLSGLGDGTITLSVTLTDDAGNTGTAATSTVSKDATAPNFISVDDDGGDNSYKSGESLAIVADLGETGLTVTADLSVINSGLSATAAMTDNADGTYSITVADVDDAGNMIEGASIAVSLTATDGSGNQQTDNSLILNLDKTAPAGYSISIDQADINATNHTAMSFTFAGAEVGTSYDYTITSDGGGTPLTGSGTITTATDQITGLDISGLIDGTITVSVTLTDEVGNLGSATTDNVTKTAAIVDFNTTNGNGDESDSTASIQVDLSITSSQDITVDYSVTGGTATGSGVDYTLADGTLTIPSGNATGSITIPTIVDDAITEGNETIIVTLSNPSNATLNTNAEYTFTINDNDGAELSITATTQAEEDDTDGLFTITTSNEFSTDVNVTFSVAGTATEGTDYDAVGTSVTFPASTSSVTIQVAVIADTDVELDETVIITLSSTDNAVVTIGDAADATITISDNDEKLPQTISFEPITDKRVGDDPVELQATGGDSGEPVIFSITTQPASGVASLANGVITLEGSGTVTITASQAGNDFYEPAEDVSQTFEIMSNELLLPTLFSPNNDQINDRFILRGGGDIQQIEFFIYDREGNLVYQSANFDELTQSGWDGTKSGVKQPQGAYIWVVSGSLSNGSPVVINGKNKGIIRLAR